MTYSVWPELRYFDRNEFDRPEMMVSGFLVIIDEWRHRCGFPIIVTDDGRNEQDMINIYGPDRSNWTNSPHMRGLAIDCKPASNSVQQADERRMIMFARAVGMWEEGMWPRLGIEYATRHIHVDNDDELRRPHGWPGVSK